MKVLFWSWVDKKNGVIRACLETGQIVTLKVASENELRGLGEEMAIAA